jgi:uncharacterized protein
MRNLIAVCVVMLVMVSSALGEPEPKGTPSELTAYLRGLQRSATLTELTGESKIEAQADKVIVELSIKTENSSLETCLKSNQETRETIITELIEAGIPADKINAESFSSTPGYGPTGNKPGKYKARNLVKITFTNKVDFQEIAKIVDQYSEVEYLGLTFKHSKENELKKQAAEQAIDDLMKKKAEYEKKLGVTLNLRSFSEETIVPQAPQTYDYNTKASSGEASPNSREMSKSTALTEETAFPFCELVFATKVTGEFELRSTN